MGKTNKPPFGAVPIRAFADARLTELHFRMLGVIAFHDRMSLTRGEGQGCWASSATMAQEIGGYNLTNVSTAISQLAKLGYLHIEKRPNDKRLRVYRVIYEPDNHLPDGQATDDADHLPTRQAIDESSLPTGKQSQKVVCPDEYLSDWENNETSPQYISLSDERYFAEASEINSVETARHAFCASRDEGISAGQIGPVGSRKDAAEAGCASGVSIDALLKRQVPSFPNLAQRNPDAALSHFEKAFAAINRDADGLDPRERKRWSDWLLAVMDECGGTSTGNRAYRLYEEFAGWAEPDEAPADLPIDQLRNWARAAIGALGYGGQQKLADDAGVPASYLSRFRNGKSLPERYRQDLLRACDRTIPFTSWRAAA